MHHLKKGDKAPGFNATDQNGNKISLKNFKGKKLVIYFYPRNFTPTCTVQACNLRDNFSLLENKGIALIGISGDDEKSHKKFSEKHGLPFSVLADTDHKISMDYGVWGEKKFMGKVFNGIHRTTFIIDEKGMIMGIINKPKSKVHAEEILKSLEQ